MELWLSQLGHATRADRRMLVKAATTLVDMPATFTAFRSGQLSWSQTRAIVCAAAKLRRAERGELDTALTDDLASVRNEEPDEITWRVELFALAIQDSRLETTDAEPEPEGNRADMQPRLDGSGGKLYADLDALGFAIADQAFASRMRRPDGLEADPANEPDPTARAGNRDTITRSRGDALVDIFRESLDGHSGCGDDDHDDDPFDNGDDRDDHDDHNRDGDGGDDGGDDGGGDSDGGPGELGGDGGAGACKVKSAQPLVLATTTLDDLIGLTHGPGELLTTLTGGRIRITNAALRKLIDEGGAALRLIVTEDTGRAVGVGRKTRVPPGWLREASLALHPECLEPNCRRSARQCDLDHAIPWGPGGEQRPAGSTDLDNLGPLDRSGHTRKDRRGWKLSPMQSDGNRYWIHERTGMTIAIPPATRRLKRPRARQEPGARPPSP
ncbi:MAG: HNH endonuclease [Actinobacteria bacterium]|nr:HNH endonuclease [Actinomycetota bacterium]